MLFRTGTVFDEAAALDELINKFGIDETSAKSESPSKKKKRKSDSVKSEGDGDSPSGAKKQKKTEIIAVEENRPAAEAIKEMADIFFKHKDNRKGGKKKK